ncbi:MAG: LppX_LprAFG lipoprotein [Actinomycetota bacterium]
MGPIVRWRRGVVAAVVAAFLASVLAACSSGGPAHPSTASLPPAAGLLKDSAAAMKKVGSARFDLAGSGRIAGVEVRSAQGLVTADGRAQGSVKIVQAGAVVELQLVVVGGDIYIKGPTGQFAKLPAAAAGASFDPSQILNPDRGLSALLQFATDGKTLGEEQVDGVDAYRVMADLDGSLVSHLMPLPAANKVPGTLWVAKDTSDLIQVAVTAPQAGGQSAHLTLHLSDFGVQTHITPPT